MPLLNPFKHLPKLPKPPRLSQIIKGANPLKEVIDDSRELIRTGREEVSSIAEALRVEGPPKPAPAVEPAVEPPAEEIKEDQIKGGTAGLACSVEHIGDVASSDIAEALRMARSRGLKDPEVRRRLTRARQELNQLERDDLTPEKIVKSPQEEQELAHWVLPRSATMRHSINDILMRDKDIEDLEKLAAYANETAEGLTERVDALPPEQKASDECLEVKSLKSFLEERRLKGGQK